MGWGRRRQRQGLGLLSPGKKPLVSSFNFSEIEDAAVPYLPQVCSEAHEEQINMQIHRQKVPLFGEEYV